MMRDRESDDRRPGDRGRDRRQQAGAEQEAARQLGRAVELVVDGGLLLR